MASRESGKITLCSWSLDLIAAVHSYLILADLPLTDTKSNSQNLEHLTLNFTLYRHSCSNKPLLCRPITSWQVYTQFNYIGVIKSHMQLIAPWLLPLLIVLSLCLSVFIFTNFYNHVVQRRSRKMKRMTLIVAQKLELIRKLIRKISEGKLLQGSLQVLHYQLSVYLLDLQ